MASTTSTTSTGQRIVIWIILAFTVLSTVALYAGVVVGQNNANQEARKAQDAKTEFDKYVEEQQTEASEMIAKQVTPKVEALSDKYFAEFSEYKSRAKSFNKANVKELSTKNLKEGSGAEIKDDFTDYLMYYIGFKPDGTIFDSSLDGEKLKEPLPGAGSYIEGWTEGVKGMKMGGVREISIPSEKAYGESGSGEEGSEGYIEPSTPLKFVVMAIAKGDFKTSSEISKTIKYPKGTIAACEKAYIQIYGEEIKAMCAAEYEEK